MRPSLSSALTATSLRRAPRRPLPHPIAGVLEASAAPRATRLTPGGWFPPGRPDGTRRRAHRARPGAHHRRQAEREAELDRVKQLAAEKLLPEFEGREKEISAA
ncbi:hypothetical protein, partial [Streptomyces minutiscleroticus]|uniref:hypothetical protein n=1 Tax=Streptomyces minutiscleroticus TaxID=68238 RepID=UPI0033242379